MRLIDAEQFAAVLQDLADKHAEDGKTDVSEILLSVKGMLERQETIEAVAVVHGRWNGGYPHLIQCSVCGETPMMSVKTVYCPNCGAKMDLE